MAGRDLHAARLAALLADAARVLNLRFALKLWTGERIGPATGPALVLSDPAALAWLALRPGVERAVALWYDGAIDVEGGTIFDIAALRPRVKARALLKALGRRRLAALLPSLIALSRAKRAGGEGVAVGAGAGESGSTAAAIRFHYDVSNRFYALFLDRRMVYTCAYFTEWHDDLERAQHDKLEMICRKLRLKPGERLLDIGCGWGALLIHAARHHGVVGHGVTLSDAQASLARERVAEAGLSDRITIELKPFEDLTGRFDKIASIGMYEHVGFANHDRYFSTVHRLLEPRGLYLHHAIARPAKGSMRRFRKGSAEYRALTRLIFPGGELDFLGHSLERLETHRFEVHDVENWREHYARTLRLWAGRLTANMEAASLEAGTRQARLWLLYLSGCALAFERGTVTINQTLASRRARDDASGVVPPTRADLYRVPLPGERP